LVEGPEGWPPALKEQFARLIQNGDRLSVQPPVIKKFCRLPPGIRDVEIVARAFVTSDGTLKFKTCQISIATRHAGDCEYPVRVAFVLGCPKQGEEARGFFKSVDRFGKTPFTRRDQPQLLLGQAAEEQA
jgi:hypothetical protein